jgi:hypothetical protein
MLRNLAQYDRDAMSAKFKNISCTASLLNISGITRAHSLLDEIRGIRTQMGTQYIRNGLSVWDPFFGGGGF